MRSGGARAASRSLAAARHAGGEVLPPTSSVPFLCRQLVVATVAGAVVLSVLVVVGVVLAQGRGASHAALRPAADGSGVVAVSPVAEASRSLVWAVVAALVAVAGVLAVLVDHAVRVARFAVLGRPGRDPHNDAAAPEAAREE